MLDAWIIEQLKKQKEKRDREREDDNVLRIPIPEEKPCPERDNPVEYPSSEIEIKT